MYKEEYSSSVYLPNKDENLVMRTMDMAKKKKRSFTVVKHSLMRLKTTKQEVYVFQDQDSPPQFINSSDSSSHTDNIKNPRSHVKADEKIKTLTTCPESNQQYPVDSVIQDTTNQTCYETYQISMCHRYLATFWHLLLL